MKNSVLFKTLIDFLFFLHAFAFPGFLVMLPLGTSTNIEFTFDVENWTLMYWAFLILSLTVYVTFLRGLYFLRKVARLLLSKKYFTQEFISNMKTTGTHFLIAGTLYFVLLLGIWINKLTIGQFELKYNTNVITPLFICIIGLFFIIQSRTFTLAKKFKEENELTV